MMPSSFYIAALVMIIAALALVVYPLVRYGRQHGRPRGLFVLVLSLGLALPVASVLLYALVGQPGAIGAQQQAAAMDNMSMEEAVARLEEQLQADPDNLEGWLLLARSYGGMRAHDKARDAFAHAMELAPEDADIMVAWVEADSLASETHMIDGHTRAVLQRALSIDPDNQRGLWLKGISDYQAGAYDQAVSTWQHLHTLLPQDSDVATAIHEQITMAKARADGKTQAEAERLLQSSGSAPAASEGNDG